MTTSSSVTSIVHYISAGRAGAKRTGREIQVAKGRPNAEAWCCGICWQNVNWSLMYTENGLQRPHWSGAITIDWVVGTNAREVEAINTMS